MAGPFGLVAALLSEALFKASQHLRLAHVWRASLVSNAGRPVVASSTRINNFCVLRISAALLVAGLANRAAPFFLDPCVRNPSRVFVPKEGGNATESSYSHHVVWTGLKLIGGSAPLA